MRPVNPDRDLCLSHIDGQTSLLKNPLTLLPPFHLVALNMSQSNNPSFHQLSPSESSHIFTTNVLPIDVTPFPRSPTPSKPYALLALGQTGAGKTLLVPPLLTALKRHGRNPAHLIADVYKTYHPSYFELPPKLASQACSKDARIWLEMAVRAACERRVDVLIESACRQPEDFIGLVEILREAGYEISVVVLAVPYALSRLGILVRYFEKLPESGSRGLGVRLTPTKVHDDSHKGLFEAAEWLDRKENLVNRCIVVRRGNLVAFVAQRDAEASINGSIAEALRRERERPLTDTERVIARDGLERLAKLPEAEEASAEVKVLLEPLLVSEESANQEFPELWPLQLTGDDIKEEENILRMKLFGLH